MSNLSKIKRDVLLSKIKEMKNILEDDDMIETLSEVEKEITRKKYGLVWEEHEEYADIQLRNSIISFSEEVKNNIDDGEDKLYNFILEGDNLHSLYLLEKTHNSKVDFIYIDPPYNTKKDGFMYNDNLSNKNDAFIHSKWLSFMERRLKLARKLLAYNGIICISIDDNEYAQLKLLCDEIFGEHNLLSSLCLKVRYDNKSLNEDNDWQPVMEYVLIYAKNSLEFCPEKPTKPYDISKFEYRINELTDGVDSIIAGRKVTIFKEGEWSIEKLEPNINLLKETWASGSIVRQSGTAAEFLSKHLISRKNIDGLNALYKVDGMGSEGDGLGYRYITGPKKTTAIRGKFYTGIPIERRKEIDLGRSSNKTSPIINFYNFEAEFGNIRNEGGVAFNGGKKPVALLKKLISFHPNKDLTVLDFFAGSGTTGHAVIELNKDDGGNRNFILATNNENNICENITYKRIKNVIRGYGKKEGISSNLKYYKLKYIPKRSCENIKQLILENIEKLVQLEFSTNIDDKKIVIILNEEKLDSFFEGKEVDLCEKLFVPSEVLFTSEQEEYVFKHGIEVLEIPQYYYADELKEVHEL